MKRILAAVVVLSLMTTVLALPAPAWAWGRGGFHHGFHHGGCCFFGGFGLGLGLGVLATAPFWYPPAYAYPVYPVYPAPVPTYATPAPPATWYYCRSAGAYYPYVPSCPEAWVQVPAQ